MHPPVNFDSVVLDALLSDWLGAMQEHAVEALVVLGPDPFGPAECRNVLAAHPPRLREAAQALADATDFGFPWRDAAAPLVSWQHIAQSSQMAEQRWRRLWLAHGFQTTVRGEFPLVGGRAFEVVLFSRREFHHRAESALLAWSVLNFWPMIKKTLVEDRSILSPRERECLALALNGLTARETATQLACAERTVTFHLANAMVKLKVDSKLAAIQRACWLGVL